MQVTVLALTRLKTPSIQTLSATKTLHVLIMQAIDLALTRMNMPNTQSLSGTKTLPGAQPNADVEGALQQLRVDTLKLWDAGE